MLFLVNQNFLNNSPLYDEVNLQNEIAEGNMQAFKSLYEHHHQKVYSFAFFITRSTNLAEEVTQEVFIRIWTNRHKLPRILNLNAWIKTIVRNLAYTYLHRLAIEKTAMQNIMKTASETDGISDSHIDDPEYVKLIDEAIENLPAQQKKVILLSREEAMKQKIIAEKMGITISTVKNHKKAALQSIRTYLEQNTDATIVILINLFFTFF